jgi:hypothetical protein
VPSIRKAFRAPDKVHRELFEMDVRRVLRAGWFILAVSSALEILTLPGRIQSWQWSAVGIIFAALTLIYILDRTTHALWSFALMPFTLLILPITFADASSEPWLSYGLIIICTVVHTTVIEDYRIALVVVYVLTILQYTVAKLNLSSISDNEDNLLLGGYFSISWTLVVGIGAMFIRRAYLNYSDAIEDSVLKVRQMQERESRTISELNIKDHLNSQLHGTVLNTLIAIKNSQELMRDQKVIARYLNSDLMLLQKEPELSNLTLAEFMREEVNFLHQRPLDITFNFNLASDLDPLIYEVIKELLREVILNIKKHSKATTCQIEIDMSTSDLGLLINTSVMERHIVIRVMDNSPEKLNQSDDSVNLDFRSESVSRLLKRVDGKIIQSWDSNHYLQEIEFASPEKYESHLDRIKTLRQESIKYLSKGYIFLSLFYSLITFPAFIYLEINSLVATLYFAQILLVGGSFVFKKYEFELAAMGSLIAISIFPLLATTAPLVCQDLQYLPWIFNSLLGSVFYVTLVTKSNWLKWVPIFLFLVSNLNIQRQLPAGCKNLLDGSIPGIILILVISIGFAIARKRSRVSQENLIASAMSAYGFVQNTKDLVRTEREYVVSHLKDFVALIESKNMRTEVLRQRVESLILFLRTYLLTSEYFESPLIFQIYRYSIKRNEKGISTFLDITTNQFETGLSRGEIEAVFKQIQDLTRNVPVVVQVSSSDLILVNVLAQTDRAIKPLLFQKENLRIQLLKDS